MKLVFMGTPDFAVPTLEKLAQSRHEVLLVVTGPDKPRGRGQRLRPTPVKEAAQKLGLPVYQPESLRDPAVAEHLRTFPADLYVVVAFRILPEQIIEIPPRGVINLHASLLPKYRGAAPIQWAILNGEKETGLTTFFIEKGIDTGDIILQEKVEIFPGETAGELHDRLARLGAELVLKTVDLIEAGKAPRRKQEGEATRAPKIRPEMAEIHWDRPADEIERQIRAFSPVPGAFTFLHGKRVKIYRAQKAPVEIPPSPGKIRVEQGQRLLASARDGWLEILELQEEGRKRLKAEEFLRGHGREGLEAFDWPDPAAEGDRKER